ncbi:MAG TPA: PVC-type heme-binding CxxCH protein [Pirellulales bacterium]|nr:PVC-type heme-binding CxxCH protein [Pirellulales bacterium]
MRPFFACLVVCCVAAAPFDAPSCAAPPDGNRLTYLDDIDPWYPHLRFPRLTTPQWVGEKDVDAVVILAIDDMRGHEKWEAYLRPILERLKEIDGRAPVSIMTCQIDPADPHLQKWLAEGLSLEVHTYDHPCPLLGKGDLAKSKATYDRCVDLLAQVPGNRPVAFRTPCCDSLNTVSPRFFAEIFNQSTSALNFLQIDSSVFNFTTSNDSSLPREWVLDEKGADRFAKYLPSDRAFVNKIEDYPYPYVVGGLCWEFPCVAPSDWSAQHLQKPNNPLTVADLKLALDATVAKQGVFDLVFHPHGWIRAEQVNELIDHAVAKYGPRVKFLTFREALDRLNKNLLAGQPLRDPVQHRRTATPRSGFDHGIRLLDLNADGYLDVVIGNHALRQTRLWSPRDRSWTETSFPAELVVPIPDGAPQPAGGRFGIGPGGRVWLLSANEFAAGAWEFDGTRWTEIKDALAGLEMGGGRLYTVHGGRDRGVRLRDLDGDGATECLVGNASQTAVFRWEDKEHRWRRLPFDLPEGTSIVDDQGRDAGLRFVDLDEDGHDDIVFSDDAGYSIDLFESPETGWSRRVLAGKRPEDAVVPPFVVNSGNNGAWFSGRHLWVQNEYTDKLPNLVDHRSFGELIKDVEPQARPPRAALTSMVARPGFQVELMACEPLTMDPVAFAWGADGKFWIVEMADYPLGIDGKGTPGGRVRFLEDRDGDGSYDTSTLFLEGLTYPNGVMPWRKGVLVTCAPEIFYAEDTDGDGRADVRKTLYRGFGEGNPQHRVNGLRWGLDNWVYCANGDSGGGIESLLTGDKVQIGGRDFRIRPEQGSIEAQTGQTQYMRERDDWGNWFGNNNSNPMFHYALDDHYLRRNPHVAPPEPRVQVSLTPGAAPVFPVSRTLPRFNDHNTANRFTSACSAIIYRDDLFGPRYAGSSFVSEPVHNLVHREIVYSDGFTFHSRRADDERQSEFLASTDNWCRPSMLRVGPDGALWMADMYRQVIEHPEWIPKDVQAKYDLRAGHDKGRIYRVYPVGATPRSLPRLDRLDTTALVAALDSPSGWQRDTVQQLLIERNDPTAVPVLKALLADTTKPVLARLHALCTLDGLKAVDAQLLRASLGIHPGIDRHVVRLSEPFLDEDLELAKQVAALVVADDAQLLMQLAYTLGEWHAPGSGQALGRLALRMASRETAAEETSNLPLPAGEGSAYFAAAILSSVTADNLTGMLDTLFASPDELARLDDFVRQIAILVGLMDDDVVQMELMRQVTHVQGDRIFTWQITALDGLLNGLGRRGKDLRHLWKSKNKPNEELERSIARLVSQAEAAARDRSADEGERLQAVRLAGRLAVDRPEGVDLLRELLAPQTSAAIQTAAVTALTQLDNPRAPEILIAGWAGYGPDLRGQVIDSLLGRETWLRQLLGEIESGRVPTVAIDAARRQRLLEHPQEDIRRQAEKLFAGAVNSDRQQVVERYRDAPELTGSTDRGTAVFKKSCATCHRLADIGHAVGPDLSALSDRSPQAMLTAIFDPNRAVEAKFLNYTAVTNAGVTYTGMLAAETGNSITLLGADSKTVTLLRDDLEELASSTKSLMPEGLEKDIAPQDVADLLAFLSGFRPPSKTFAGNTPKTVLPEALRGEFWLLAENAEIYGKTLIFEPLYRNLGYWQSGDDHAVWSLDVSRPGKYAVSFDYACDNGTAGQTVAVEISGQRLLAKVAGTGNWDTYRQMQLGAVELAVGVHQLIVRPDGGLRGPLLDLKAVRLRPVK